ncbi:hypothetical protein HDG40_007943 [Paraburkholderia sp. JPY158]|uniref:Uncharacterized protein n=1 Tax=Paraburkholderia atlantica TaxID=2654982 RepID=A0A7W8Q1M2_PARAM|nr:hypothetical protein [Paraburkholderia atlantica]MBB5429745.1 hypothetical protein [Paraburkholderia atlantica]
MCRQIPVVCFPAVLLPCVISNTYQIDISRPDTLTATEPYRLKEKRQAGMINRVPPPYLSDENDVKRKRNSKEVSATQ